jgi:hypothetical protein
MLAVVQLVAAVFGFFILLIGLNGFSERQATPSLIFYIVLSVVTVLGDGWLSFLFVRYRASAVGPSKRVTST